MYTDFELTLILGGPKCHHGLPVTVRPYEDQVIQGLLAQALLTVDPVGPLTYPVAISPVLEWKYVTITYNLFQRL